LAQERRLGVGEQDVHAQIERSSQMGRDIPQQGAAEAKQLLSHFHEAQSQPFFPVQRH